MSARTIRRAAERKALKVARKAGFPIPQPTPPAIVPESTTIIENILEPGFPFPSLAAISPAHLDDNLANAQLITGPEKAETRVALRRNGTFKLLASEDFINFEALKQSLLDEHLPATQTEFILVNSMVESHWLASRAQRLQDTCIDPDTGVLTNEKTFFLYMRCQTTHTRAFHKSLNDLLRLRAERRKAELGVEAQKIANEKHAMKKQSHYWHVLKKDAEACHQISANTIQNIKARAENPSFEAEYTAELAKRHLEINSLEVASKAA